MPWRDGSYYHKKCAVCGREMKGCRSDRKTCSDRCRKRLSRIGQEPSHLTDLKCDTPTRIGNDARVYPKVH